MTGFRRLETQRPTKAGAQAVLAAQATSPKTPLLAVDCVVVHRGSVLLVERKNPPLGLALPGGFVDVGETLLQAACRELREETGVSFAALPQVVGVRDHPTRDPRQHVVSIVFFGHPQDPRPTAGDDATAANWYGSWFEEELVFDHMDILLNAQQLIYGSTK
jgi:8-oxo-dGTP diphosphatase